MTTPCDKTSLPQTKTIAEKRQNSEHATEGGVSRQYSKHHPKYPAMHLFHHHYQQAAPQYLGTTIKVRKKVVRKQKIVRSAHRKLNSASLNYFGSRTLGGRPPPPPPPARVRSKEQARRSIRPHIFYAGSRSQINSSAKRAQETKERLSHPSDPRNEYIQSVGFLFLLYFAAVFQKNSTEMKQRGTVLKSTLTVRLLV